MKRLVALQRCSYAGRAFEAGAEFEVEDIHEEVFVRAGLAKRPTLRLPKRQQYRTRVMTAAKQ